MLGKERVEMAIVGIVGEGADECLDFTYQLPESFSLDQVSLEEDMSSFLKPLKRTRANHSRPSTEEAPSEDGSKAMVVKGGLRTEAILQSAQPTTDILVVKWNN